MSNDFLTNSGHVTSPFQRGVTLSNESHMNDAIEGASETEAPILEAPDDAVTEDTTMATPPTVEELQRQKDELDRQIAERQKAEKQAVIQQILDVACQYNISIEDLVEAMGGFKPKRKGVKAIAKYQDPVTKVTWSGRGKEPTWLKGRNREDFLIKDD